MKLSDDNGDCHEDELRNSNSPSFISSRSNSVGVLDLEACGSCVEGCTIGAETAAPQLSVASFELELAAAPQLSVVSGADC